MSDGETQAVKDQPSFNATDAFRNNATEGDTVRLVVEPVTPLRGTDSFDGAIISREEDGESVQYTVESAELVDGDLDENYKRIHARHRFSLAKEIDDGEDAVVTVETDWSGHHSPPEWEVSGYLVNAGILEMLN